MPSAAPRPCATKSTSENSSALLLRSLFFVLAEPQHLDVLLSRHEPDGAAAYLAAHAGHRLVLGTAEHLPGLEQVAGAGRRVRQQGDRSGRRVEDALKVERMDAEGVG